MLITGVGLVGAGLGVLAMVAWGWIHRDYQAAASLLPPALGTMLLTLGVQNALGGFLLAIIGGHEARFFHGLGEGAAAEGSGSAR